MKILKTISKDQVRLLMDYDYNNVYGRIRYVLGKEAILFSDIRIKNPELHWVVRDDAEYVALSELPSEKASLVKNLLSEKISYVTNVLSEDSLIGDHVAKIITYPSDNYIFVKETNGELNVVIAGWGCNLSTLDNKGMPSVEDCTEDLPEEPISENVNTDSSNTSSVGHNYHNNDNSRNVTTYNTQTNKIEHDYLQSDTNVSFKKASLGSRFLASLLDGFISGILAIPACFLYAIGISMEIYNYVTLALILYLIPLTYTFIKDGLGNGQSWGKNAMGLRTIKVKDYSKCTKGTSVLRALVSTLVSMIPLVGWIIEPIMVLTTSDGRRLADKAAGTMVVNS